jgi:hypothetical protein
MIHAKKLCLASYSILTYSILVFITSADLPVNTTASISEQPQLPAVFCGMDVCPPQIFVSVRINESELQNVSQERFDKMVNQTVLDVSNYVRQGFDKVRSATTGGLNLNSTVGCNTNDIYYCYGIVAENSNKANIEGSGKGSNITRQIPHQTSSLQCNLLENLKPGTEESFNLLESLTKEGTVTCP